MFDDDFDETDFPQPEKLPIYQKGKEIFDIVWKIGELISDDESDLHVQFIKGEMLSNAGLLSVKVAGAEAGDLYDIRMECAAIIRKAARELILLNHPLKDLGFQYVEYFDMVRELIEEYRILFIDWVAGFDKFNATYDDWGLFNPSGVDLRQDF